MINASDFSLLGRCIEITAKKHNLCTSTIRKKQQLIARILRDTPTVEPEKVKQFLTGDIHAKANFLLLQHAIPIELNSNGSFVMC